MTITITQQGMELTPAIRQYVEEKMQAMQKYFDSIRHMDVMVGVANAHQHKGKNFFCKVDVQVGSDVMQVEKDAEDLYKAIDKVKDHLRVELVEWKKRLAERSNGRSASEEVV